MVPSMTNGKTDFPTSDWHKTSIRSQISLWAYETNTTTKYKQSIISWFISSVKETIKLKMRFDFNSKAEKQEQESFNFPFLRYSESSIIWNGSEAEATRPMTFWGGECFPWKPVRITECHIFRHRGPETIGRGYVFELAVTSDTQMRVLRKREMGFIHNAWPLENVCPTTNSTC